MSFCSERVNLFEKIDNIMHNIQLLPSKLNVKHGLEVLSVIFYVFCMSIAGPLCLVFAFYLILCTSWRWLTILYLIWIWVVDKNMCHKGGRRFKWARNMTLWKHARYYFPTKLEKAADVELDPKRNYLFCCFPHGIFSTGSFLAFCTNACDVDNLFPRHTTYMLTLTISFFFPFTRELGLSIGGCSASSDSINYILSKPEGGNIAALVVGGASEAFNCGFNPYKIILKKRKGFVKLAIKNGASLVPVISFGETDIYTQVPNPKGSLLRKLQETLKDLTGFAPLIPFGRAYTLLPLRKPITTLVGRPIDVQKISNPTQEQVDALHEKFITELSQLFEEHKRDYIKYWENVKLEIE